MLLRHYKLTPKMDINIVIFASICFYHASYVLADENNVRLRDGDTDTSGRVEISSDNVWRPICDEDWTIQDSTVVCRQLNLGLFGIPVKGERYVKNPSPIRVTKICRGSEERLEDCDDKHDRGDCDEDSPIIRTLCNPEMRLKGSGREGVVELFSREEYKWKQLRDKDLLNHEIATEICHRLGLGSEGFVLSTSEKTVTDEIFGSGEDLEEASSLYDPDTYSVVSCIGEFDPCEDNPCSSNGACTHQKNGRYVCICYDGFTGDDCGSENSASHRSPLLTYLFIFIFVIIIVIVAAVIFLYFKFNKELIRSSTPNEYTAMAMNQTYNQNMNSTEADKQNKMVNENQSNAEAVYETPDVKPDQKESDHKNKMEVYEVF
ncbi:scavenger receptor cysteine-rich domain superfamily protein-like isoform X2 [Apostichopus japonicus]|uniref:scavenger receptor cysteine-rich domain superfamily protein-like isoform X2 n=1 Tax=Stichopus japonicus TaxID=307972 RepID=UPI003AB3A6DA